MWLALLAPAALGAAPLVTVVGEPRALGLGGNWPRIFALEEGWLLFTAGGGDYSSHTLNDDLVAQGGYRPLTGRSDLVDHAIERCPDGRWLHIASANLDQNDDSAYAFRYSAELVLEQQGTIAERDTEHHFQDAPLVCTENIQGAVFEPLYKSFPELFTLTKGLELDQITEVEELPPSPGSSLWWDHDADSGLSINTTAEDAKLYLTRLNADFSAGDQIAHEVGPPDQEVYWPQGVVRVGDYFLIAHMQRDPTAGWVTDTGDVYLQVLDSDLALLESHRLTALSPPQGAMQPWIAVKGDRAVVSLDVDQQAWVVELELSAELVGEEPQDTGDTGGGETADTADTAAPVDSGGRADTGGAPQDTETPEQVEGVEPIRSGCGCAAGAAGGSGWLLLAAGAVGWRRRRPAGRPSRHSPR